MKTLSHEHVINEIEMVLKDLVDNAQKIQEVSSQTISQDELNQLQERQEELIQELIRWDEIFHENHKKSIKEADPSTWQKIKIYLTEFEKLNQEFIKQLSIHQRVITFRDKEK